MRVYNLTDVETKQLKRMGWVDRPIRISGTTIPSGGVADLRGTGKEQVEVIQFVHLNLLAIGEPPEWYTTRKAPKVRPRLPPLVVQDIVRESSKAPPPTAPFAD